MEIIFIYILKSIQAEVRSVCIYFASPVLCGLFQSTSDVRISQLKCEKFSRCMTPKVTQKTLLTSTKWSLVGEEAALKRPLFQTETWYFSQTSRNLQSFFSCLYFESAAGCLLSLTANESRLFSQVGEAKHERRSGPEGLSHWFIWTRVSGLPSSSSLNSLFSSALVFSNSREKHQAPLDMIIVVVRSPAPPVCF